MFKNNQMYIRIIGVIIIGIVGIKLVYDYSFYNNKYRENSPHVSSSDKRGENSKQSSEQVNLKEGIIQQKETLSQKVNHNILSYQILDKQSIQFSQVQNGKKMVITLAPCGINELIGIKNIQYEDLNNTDNSNDNNDAKNMEEKATSYDSASDWIGPYIVRSLGHDIVKKSIPRFTGGWHGSDGGGTGDKTAKVKEVKFYCGDQELTSLSTGETTELSIQVIHELLAYNSQRPVLEEKITYNITYNKIDVHVEGKALNDLVIERYYGLQTLNSIWSGTVTYNYSDQTTQAFPAISTNDAKPKNEVFVDFLHLSSINKDKQLEVGIYRGIGIGDFSYLEDTLSTCFTKDYGKSYFNLVNGIPLQLKQEETFEWKGYYNFISY